MATERQIQETIARCVATVVFYHNSPRTRHSVILMTAEVRATAAGVSEFGLSAYQTEEQILRPVESELIARYGAEAGRLLAREFTKAFGGTAGPIPVLSPFAV